VSEKTPQKVHILKVDFLHILKDTYFLQILEYRGTFALYLRAMEAFWKSYGILLIKVHRGPRGRL